MEGKILTPSKQKTWYSSEETPKGTMVYEHWLEYFQEMDTNTLVPIVRTRPHTLNGEPLRWYSNSEIRAMSKEERKAVIL